MKLIKLTLTLATFGLAVATAASSYTVSLNSPTWVGETKLNAGEYKLQIVGDKAIFKSGKTTAESPVTVGTNDKKFSLTSAQVLDSKIKEIDLGGTKTKLLFPAAAMGGASGSK
jgi:hypothetical protein